MLPAEPTDATVFVPARPRPSPWWGPGRHPGGGLGETLVEPWVRPWWNPGGIAKLQSPRVVSVAYLLPASVISLDGRSSEGATGLYTVEGAEVDTAAANCERGNRSSTAKIAAISVASRSHTSSTAPTDPPSRHKGGASPLRREPVNLDAATVGACRGGGRRCVLACPAWPLLQQNKLRAEDNLSQGAKARGPSQSQSSISEVWDTPALPPSLTSPSLTPPSLTLSLRLLGNSKPEPRSRRQVFSSPPRECECNVSFHKTLISTPASEKR